MQNFSVPPRWFYGVAVVLAAATLFAQDNAKKAPVPSKAAQAEAMKVVKEVYGSEWTDAITTAQKRAFAKRLLDKAAGTNDDPTSKFVLLNTGKGVALQAVDGETAFAAIDQMFNAFAIDALQAKMSALEVLRDKARTAADSDSIAKLAIALQARAAADDKLDAAVELGKSALEDARKARNATLFHKAQSLLAAEEEQLQAWQAAKTALETLAKKPDDPQANLAAGKYACFFKHDWDKGIPMLALGKDAELSPLAQKDLAGATRAAEQIKLGDGWWNLAESKEGSLKIHIRARSWYWYRKALPEVSGLVKDKVVLRLTEIDKQRKEEIADTAAAQPDAAVKASPAAKADDAPQADDTAENGPVKLPVIIVKAEWGGGKNWANVTKRVKELVDAGGHIWASTDCLKSDPTPHWKKKLKIEYIKNGQKKTLWLDEGKRVDSPDFKS